MTEPGFSAVTGGTIERFLRAIATCVNPERVVEVHVFPPIQQGGIESGVAVVAAEQSVATPVAAESDVDDVAEPVLVDEGASVIVADEGEMIATASEPLIDESVASVDEDPPIADGDPTVADESEVVVEPAASRAERLTIYTAHYRLVLKGPDRGKWDWGAVVDAEAPIEAVDAVVRGVQRRAGESFDAERLSGDAFRAALALASSATSASGAGRRSG